MKTAMLAIFTFSGLLGTVSVAQTKVAEADYVMDGKSSGGQQMTKPATHWTLSCDGPLTRCHMESEIYGLPKGLRLVQVEELDQHFVPTVIGYDLYKNDEKKTDMSVRCSFSPKDIKCNGDFHGKSVTTSAGYEQKPPYWLWMEGLFSLDMPWLLDGTVNMAHLDKGTVKVPTVNVLGGTAVMIGDAINIAKLQQTPGIGDKLRVVAPTKPTQWKLYSDEEAVLELLGSGTVEIDGTAVAAKHYVYQSGSVPMNLWVTESGILLKFSNVGVDHVLAHYRQFQALIPELPVQSQAGAH